MPFASIYPFYPRTNPLNFGKKILRIGGVEKFFESTILTFFSNSFFYSIFMITMISRKIRGDEQNMRHTVLFNLCKRLCFTLNFLPETWTWYVLYTGHYSNFCTFEITSFVNVPGHYLRKYGTFNFGHGSKKCENKWRITEEKKMVCNCFETTLGSIKFND